VEGYWTCPITDRLGLSCFDIALRRVVALYSREYLYNTRNVEHVLNFSKS
jgi:hypothetical protein